MQSGWRVGTAISEASSDGDFDAFFAAEHERLFRAMVLLCGDPAEADDLAQEGFVAVLEKWDRVSVMDSPVAYLYRAAVNAHRSRVRRAVRWARRSLFERGAEDVSDAALTRTEVRRALWTLSDEQRSAVVLVDWVGLSAEEAGTVLGIEATGVRTRLHRARKALREELSNDE